MTSSYRATAHASVRATPAAQIVPAGAWSLAELSVVQPIAVADESEAPAQPQISAAEKAALIDEGYARGLADGQMKAHVAAQARVAGALAAVAATTKELNEVAALAPTILEENVAALAVIVARQIVLREVSLDRELVAGLVRRALTEFPVDQSIRIRVNPMDLSVLTVDGGLDSGTGSAPITGSRDASWLADANIARGGCLVEGRDRIVDGRVDTALERAYRRMAQVDAS